MFGGATDLELDQSGAAKPRAIRERAILRGRVQRFASCTLTPAHQAKPTL
jgi:hypothetical protein